MEYESTFNEAPPAVETVVVHDKDGRIVHIHDFIGDGTGLTSAKARAERERITLQGAKQVLNAPKGLKALHLKSGFTPEPGTLYRVDVAKKKLVVKRKVGVAGVLDESKAKSKKSR